MKYVFLLLSIQGAFIANELPTARYSRGRQGTLLMSCTYNVRNFSKEPVFKCSLSNNFGGECTDNQIYIFLFYSQCGGWGSSAFFVTYQVCGVDLNSFPFYIFNQ